MLTQVYWTPATVYDYSNFDYCMLCQVIAKETGQSYADYVRTNILNPARERTGKSSTMTIRAQVRVRTCSPLALMRSRTRMATSIWRRWRRMAPGLPRQSTCCGFRELNGRASGTALLNATSIGDMTVNPGVPVAVVNNSKLITQPQSGSWCGAGWSVNTAGN
jgi:CubicO group peptidase (beta-lactamase class C family)